MLSHPHYRTNPVRLPAWVAVALSFQCLFCTYPADSTGRDLLEIERVWQYMKAYSLYTSQVPALSRALSYSSPESLVGTLRADTLYSHENDTTYTMAGYYPSCELSGIQGCAGCTQKSSAAAMRRFGSVRFEPLTQITAYVVIDSFVSGTDDSLRTLGALMSNYTNIILDLRYNPGGSLDACTASVELFLPANVPYLYSTYRRDVISGGDTGTVSNERWTSGTTGDVLEGKRIIILMSRYTASAAEILIVALRYGLGSSSVAVIGEKSFGKSIGQFQFCFWGSSGAQLVLTGFRFYPILGPAADYHEIGITPDADAVTDSLLALIIGAGSVLEPDFELRLADSTRTRLRDLPKVLARANPACYKDVEAGKFPLF